VIANSGKTRVRFLATVVVVMSLLVVHGPKHALAAEECTDGTNTLTLSDNPVPSSNPYSGQCDSILEGGKLYFTWCVQCHGVKADGVSPRWGGYAKDLRRFWAGYSQFVAIVVAGRPKLKMPPWAGVLNPEQISYIGTYLETLALDGANWKDY
jgi:mono/diheme cytochrome c family protein